MVSCKAALVFVEVFACIGSFPPRATHVWPGVSVNALFMVFNLKLDNSHRAF